MTRKARCVERDLASEAGWKVGNDLLRMIRIWFELWGLVSLTSAYQ